MKIRIASLAAALAFASGGVAAQTAPTAGPRPRTRFRLVLNGAFALGSVGFGESRTFREFSEDGRFQADYKAAAGPAFDLGVQYDITRRFGVALAFSMARRDDDASYTTALPHPLYLNQPRNKAGDLGGLPYRESAGHLDLVYTAGTGSFAFHVFAGGTFFKVRADLIERVQYAQVYPYDEAQVTVTAVPTVSANDDPFGFNVGAAADYRLSRTFGLGVQGRYSRGKASLEAIPGSKVEIDAGGLQAAAGVRVYF